MYFFFFWIVEQVYIFLLHSYYSSPVCRSLGRYFCCVVCIRDDSYEEERVDKWEVKEKLKKIQKLKIVQSITKILLFI